MGANILTDALPVLPALNIIRHAANDPIGFYAFPDAVVREAAHQIQKTQFLQLHYPVYFLCSSP